MGNRILRRSTFAQVAILGLSVSVMAASPAPSATTVHPSGITILPPEEPEPDPIPEAAALALSEALHASELDPENFSYPFYDRTEESVVSTPTTTLGEQRVKTVRAKALGAAAPSGSASFESRREAHSRKKIDSAMDALIGVQPEGLTVTASHPDPENNRVILEVSDLNDKFLSRAAESYGADMIAIRVVGNDNTDSGPAIGREEDRSPFYGGGNVNLCSTGFSWHSGTTEMMLSAGHCWPNGGAVSTPVMSMGSVRAASEENYNTNVGTVLMTGETTYRGDLALIRIASGKSSTARIYTGAARSTSSIPVAGKWSRSPASGDLYCTGGRVSGSQCSWKVAWSAAGNFTYTKPNPDVIVRRVWKGTKKGRCIEGGDSGGPVYTVNSSGAAVAKGIISGATGYGGDDAIAGTLDPACVNVFTDIYDAYYSMPGDIN